MHSGEAVASDDPEVYFRTPMLLGEGPFWDDASQELLWVDIPRGEIHRHDDATGAHAVVSVNESVGAAVPVADGSGWIVGLRSGVALIDADGVQQKFVAIDADRPTHRMNDGKCDAAGRFWTGTLNEEAGDPCDALFRVDADLRVEQVRTEVALSNGIAWSPQNDRMYRVDSARHLVFVADFDLATGVSDNERVFLDLGDTEGEPDGMTVDAAGDVWIAMWDGWCVRRYDPEASFVASYRVPVARPTSCAFGGAAFGTLFVTSASIGLTDDDRRAQPHAGSVFALSDLGPGLPAHKFTGTF